MFGTTKEQEVKLKKFMVMCRTWIQAGTTFYHEKSFLLEKMLMLMQS